ncbi:MAG: Holliday junction resolvase RuvX [Clostridiaceae bacterium]|jgi:putative Holliday junction resolvase|nr:Holliday junction resolvase RuvX [Bacillota bacterium]NLN51812.1 Holliday junction resolvase RuvX [Clostridiaceae bacterium]
MQRFLAIDYGTVRVGLAVSDPLGVIATGIKTLNHKAKTMTDLASEINEVVIKENITDLVLGLPKRTDGKVGEKELQVREFAEILKEITGLDPILYDERYTTVIAQQIMNKTGVKPNRKREIVDQVAAEILLQNYLDKVARK